MYNLGYVYYLTNRLGVNPNHGTAGHRAWRTATHGTPNALRQALSALQIWRQRRAAIRELESLPDVTLRDIGVGRAEIPARVAASIQATDPGTGRARSQATAPAVPLKIAGRG